jgi:hypothetical protein
MNIEQEKRDNEQYSRNFTRIPNILFIAYPDLSKLEKYLYGDLRRIYWDMKPRFVSLRELSILTDYSIGALSKMIPHLHDAGLIHAEIRRARGKDGKEKGNPKYQITIVDIWEINRMFFSCSPSEQERLAKIPSAQLTEELEKSCSRNEQVTTTHPQPVHTMNKPVHEMNKPVHQMNTITPVKAHGKPSDKTPKDLFKDNSKESKKESAPDNDQPTTHTRTSSSALLTPEQHHWFERVFCHGKWYVVSPRLTQTLAEHVKKLYPIIKTVDDLNSLYDFEKERLKDKPDPIVKPGNLASSDTLNAWMQTRIPVVASKPQAPAHTESTGQYGFQDFSKNPQILAFMKGRSAR